MSQAESEQLPGFTPFRRPPVPSFVDTPVAANSVAWTSTRCSRLIRPISSRIATLRKQRLLQTSQLKPAALPEKPSLELEKTVVRAEEEEQGEDVEWIPDNHLRKRPRRTYSTRGSGTSSSTRRARKQPSNGNEAVAVQTFAHITTRVDVQEGDDEGRTDSQENGGPPGKRKYMKNSKLENRNLFRQLAKASSPVDWLLYDGIYSSLDHLLRSTEKSKPRPETGARSLFSMCLAKVPGIIAAEEQEVEETEHESGLRENIAGAMYEDLEKYGSTSGAGWKPLREVARAHGVAIICSAIEDKIIPASISRSLIILCIQASAYEEAETLCSALLSTIHGIGKPKDKNAKLFSSDTSTALQTLWDTAVRTCRWEFLFSSVAKLFTKAKLPVQWVGSDEMFKVLHKAFMISDEKSGDSRNGLQLIKVALRLCYQEQDLNLDSVVHGIRLKSTSGQGHKRSKKSAQARFGRPPKVQNPAQQVGTSDAQPDPLITTAASNIVSILLSASCTRCALIPSLWMNYWHTVLIDLIRLQETAETTCSKPIPQMNHDVETIIVFARELLPYAVRSSVDVSRLPHFRSKLDTGHVEPTHLSETFSAYLRSAATCWSNFGILEGSDLNRLDRLLHSCINVAGSQSILPSSLYLKVALTTAFDYAESTKISEDFDWALEIEELVQATGNALARAKTSDTSAPKQSSQTSYRWDDGICEWVAKTPDMAKQKSRIEPMVLVHKGEAEKIKPSFRKATPASTRSPSSTENKHRLYSSPSSDDPASSASSEHSLQDMDHNVQQPPTTPGPKQGLEVKVFVPTWKETPASFKYGVNAAQAITDEADDCIHLQTHASTDSIYYEKPSKLSATSTASQDRPSRSSTKRKKHEGESDEGSDSEHRYDGPKVGRSRSMLVRQRLRKASTQKSKATFMSLQSSEDELGW